MIDRYTRPEMGHIFSLENKYAVWQEIEVLACEAHAEIGESGITREEAAWIREHAAFNKDEVDAIEAVTNHDVIAFLTNMGSYIDKDVPEGSPKPSRWVHYGMTSSDLGDTALCYQLVQATDILIEDCKKLGEICKRRAFEERDTLCVGRTHGIHAEPMTFGMKFGSWAWELKRDLDRLVDARKNVAFGAISGAVGTYSSIDPFVEEYVCEHLGLVHDPLSTQVISRDHHDVSGTDSPFRETSNIYDGSQFCADMAVQNVIGDSFRGATWVSIHNGGGVGWGEVINGGFGMVVDGSEESGRNIREMLFWDVNNGISRRAWARNKGSMDAIQREMDRTPDFRMTMPNLVDDNIIDAAF